MGNLKQRLIKAGRDFNYAEGVKVKAAEAVYTDQIVYVFGSEGPYLTVKRADADTQLQTGGRLLIAKHDIPLNGYGVCLPWKLVKDFDTSSAANVGDPVYLGDAPSTGRGDNLVLTAPTSGAGRLVKVGHVTVDATAANGGAMLINAAGAESWQAGARVAATDRTLGIGATPFCYHVVMATSSVDITCPFPMILVNAMYIQGATNGGTLTISKGGTAVGVCNAGGGNTQVEYLNTFDDGEKTFAAGDVIGFDVSGGNTADIAIGWFIAA